MDTWFETVVTLRRPLLNGIMEQRFSFDAVAALYDATRPDYPRALFDDIAALAGLEPGDNILEVGCGSGQATRDFVARGYRIVALDPGAALIDIARHKFAGGANVEFITSTFEAWPVEQAAYKLVASAQSWYWIAPEVRFAKSAEALVPGGMLAVFGSVPVGVNSPVHEELHQIYAHHVPDYSGVPPEAWYMPAGPVAALFEQSGLFGPVSHRSYAWSKTHSTSSFVQLLETRSYIQMLARNKREALSGAITKAIDAHGGQCELHYETHLHNAAKKA
jgi:SAM-dependent methyltransferase